MLLIACAYGAAQLTRLSHPPDATPLQNALHLLVHGHEEWSARISTAALHVYGLTLLLLFTAIWP